MLEKKKTIKEFWPQYILPFLTLVKKWICGGLKFCSKIVIRIISLLVLGILFVVPFLSGTMNLPIAEWHWYPAATIFLTMLIIDRCWRKKTTFETPIFDFYSKVGESLVLPVLSSIFVFNYYNIDEIWLWVIFAMVAIAAPAYFLALYIFDFRHNERSIEERRTAALNICKYILLYWLYDLLYMAIFNNWRIPIFVFGIIAMVMIFYNLATSFLNGVMSLQFLLPFDLLFGIGLTVYLIYMVPDSELRNIILDIAASVLGGLLALVGVAWTIKHTNASRQEDMARLEDERREEERKKHIPYLRVSFDKELPPIVVNAHIREGINLENSDDLSLLDDNIYFSINIHDFNIKNVSNTNIILKGVYLHHKYYAFEQEEIVESGACCCVKTTNNYAIAIPTLNESITLIVNDILGNTYEVICPITYDLNLGWRTVTKIGDTEYNGYGYTYVVSSAKLPILVPGDNSE